MANKSQDNLISLANRSEEERREIALKGNKASIESKKKKKLLRESLEALLESGNTQEDMCVALIQKALVGDTKAFEVVRDSIGQKPIDKQEVKQIDTDWFIDDEE